MHISVMWVAPAGGGSAAGVVNFEQSQLFSVANMTINSAAGGTGGVNANAVAASNGQAAAVAGVVQVQASGGISIAPQISAATGNVLLQAATGITNGAGGAVVVEATQLNLRNTTSGNVLASNTGNITVTGNSNVGRMQLASSTGDITLNGTVNASAAGDAIVLTANKKLVNNAGSGALTVANGARWLVWSQTPVNNSFGGLQSGNAALWGTAFNPAGPTVGGTANQFIFSDAGPGDRKSVV